MRLFIGLALLTQTIYAGTKTWTGLGADNNTSTPGNWGGVAPAANDDLAFAGSLRLTPNQVAALAVNSLSFNSGAGAFTLGGALYTVNTGGITNNSASTQTINNALTLAAAQTWSATSGNLIFGGAIDLNSSGLTIAGANNTTINGNLSTFATLTKTGNGTATISGAVTLQANPSVFTIADGTANDDMTISGIIFGSSLKKITKAGLGTLVLSGANTFTGDTSINAGVVRLENNSALGNAINSSSAIAAGAAVQLTNGISVATPFTINGGGVASDGALRNLSGANTLTGTIALGSASTIGSDAGNLTISGVVSGGFALTKAGAGTLTLSAVNTYSAGTTINGGAISVNSASSLGTGGLTINAGTLEIATGYSTTRAITLGDVASTFQVDASQTFTDTTAIGGTGSLNKTGAGAMVLGATETYTGSTNVSAGTLRINASNRIVDTSALTVSGGAFDVQTFSETVAGVTLSGGAITGTGAGTLTGSSYILQSGTASAILAGSGTVTKNTAGTVTLTGVNTLSGAVTVSAGTLTLAATSGSALGSTSMITVNSGGTVLLGASNQINNVATMSLGGGTFATGGFSEGSAGSGGASTLGLGALTLTATGSKLDFGTGTVGVLSFASLNTSTFTLTVDNWTGNFNNIGTTGSTDRLIFDSDQASNLGSFVFTGYGTGGAEFNLGGGYWEVVAATPEPSTWIEGVLGLAVVCGCHQRHCRTRRRRRREDDAGQL